MKRYITCTNEDGMSCKFGSSFSPFLLTAVDGIYKVENNITISNSNLIDGGIFQGSNITSRNIVLTVRDKDNHKDNREFLYRLFKPNSEGVLRYFENDDVKRINYYVESIDVTGVYSSRQATISLMCADPFFYDNEETVEYLAEWRGGFEFEHQFTSSKEEIGYRSLVKSLNIQNLTPRDDVGLNIEITSVGAAKNLKITNVEQNKTISIGTDEKPFNMVAGDIVNIVTEKGNKNVTLTREGVTIGINNYLSEDSEFIQLGVGNNHIGYDASEGVSNLSFKIAYTYKYNGV